jgi:hypothetical protein
MAATAAAHRIAKTQKISQVFRLQMGQPKVGRSALAAVRNHCGRPLIPQISDGEFPFLGDIEE